MTYLLGGDGDGDAAAPARAILARSAALFRELGEQMGLAAALDHLALIDDERGRAEDALARLRESLDIRRALGDRSALILSFNGLATFAASQGQPARAAGLAGAAAALKRAIGTHPGRPFDPFHRLERRLAAVRQALGEHAFAAAWAEGERMSLDQAIAYALEVTP